jgi:HAD superfamily hydrolase (TIGR01662 family)
MVREDLTLDREAAVRRREHHVESLLLAAGLADASAARDAFFSMYVGAEFFTLYPDVPDTLRQLHEAGYRLGVVSNWESRLQKLCASHGIDCYFDFWVVSEIEGYSKPHPQLYRRALELADARPDEVLHVGDKLREDVEGAAQVGIKTVLLDRAGAIADYEPRITSLPELLPLLEQHATPSSRQPPPGTARDG